MDQQSQIINPDTVISVNNDDQFLISHSTFRVDELIKELSSRFYYDDDSSIKKWFEKGMECQALIPGKPWRKGKIRVCLEFIPDEVDSPLDDIRQAIADDSQPV
jgi:hypothetical protein